MFRWTEWFVVFPWTKWFGVFRWTEWFGCFYGLSGVGVSMD